jgi:hypothetical protein
VAASSPKPKIAYNRYVVVKRDLGFATRTHGPRTDDRKGAGKAVYAYVQETAYSGAEQEYENLRNQRAAPSAISVPAPAGKAGTPLSCGGRKLPAMINVSQGVVRHEYRQRAKRSRFLLSSRDIILILFDLERPFSWGEARGHQALKKTEKGKSL